MRRNFEELNRGPFDLLVIGGGIYGCWIAYDAALRGLRVALVEQTDWAAATSSASSKLIHGGLRYLEYGQFRLVKKTLDERRRLSRLAPHHVRPLRFILPVYSGDRVGRTRLKIGLWLYDRLAGADQPVPPHRSWSHQEMKRRFKFLSRDGLRGGFSYGDCQVDDARMTLEVVDGAIRAGAAAVNRARAAALTIADGRVVGATVEDLETGRRLDLEAKVTVNCAGPWARELIADVDPGRAPSTRLTKGVHLVLPGLPVDDAFLLSSKEDRRIVFLIPWYGRTLLGTTDTDYSGDPADVRVERSDVTYLLSVANRAIEEIGWQESDVIAGYAGLRTLPDAKGIAPSAVSREWILDQPLPGLLSTVGGKFTSARADSAKAVDRVLETLDREPVDCPTKSLPLPWAPQGRFGKWSRTTLSRGLGFGLDEATVGNLIRRYGTRIDAIFEMIADQPDLARRLVPELPFCVAEIVYAVTGEMAGSLEDVLRRRVPLMLLDRLPEPTLRALADLVGELLSWSSERRAAEVGAIMNETHRGPKVHART